MNIKKRIVALVLSLLLVVSSFIGNTDLAGVTEVFAATVNAPENLRLEQTDNGLSIKWDRFENAKRYDVYRAESRYGDYKKVDTVSGLTWTDVNTNGDKYENYYKVAEEGSSQLSEPISLEMEMFGEDMYVFSPKDDVEQVYNAINDVYRIQGDVDENGNTGSGQQFGSGRYAFAFKTGDYSNMKADQYNISYYMQVLGLGKVPTDVTIKNLHVPPVLPNSNVTCNFWMGIENVSIAPVGFNTNDAYYDFLWSVSQAAPARRLNVERSARLNYMWDGWASGGYVADSEIKGNIGSWSQQQYYLRNNNINGDLYGVNWNLVTQGCTGINGDNWNSTVSKYPMYELESGLGKTNWKSGGKYTILNTTDKLREKPFLFFDEDVNEYKVFAPSMRTNAKGTSWSKNDMGEGKVLDISDFYIARADRDNAASINAALNQGKNIILSPGIYYAEEPINIKKANTIILGLGLATIIPTNTETAVKIADVDGVTLAGVILDADSSSKNMLVVGNEGSNKDHSSNPTILQDVFIRIGGVHGGVASTEEAMVINSNDVIGDHFWIWRADHGAGVGWNLNKAANGVVVNGDDVTLYGLMVEHFQEYDVLWRGENGKTYFLQNEKAYDPQNQSEWMSHNGTVMGYSAYKVANNVKNHYAVGLGCYDVFINTNGASIFLENAIEVPDTEGVMIENACTVEIANGSGPIVGIKNIVNGTGPSITTGAGSGGGYARQALLVYNNGKGTSLQDYYLTGGNEAGVTVDEVGVTPTDDPKAEKDIVKDAPSTDDSEQEEEKESVATGAFAEWKNNAITYPAKGQLVAAGRFDIEFSKLDNATKYEVYVDDKAVKTFEGAQANAETYAVEISSVEVKKHSVYVVATLNNGAKVTSNIRYFYISKKGMGVWQDDVSKIKEENLSWYYTWSLDELSGADEQAEFVPMMWGDFGNTSSKGYQWIKNGGYKDYKYLLTFNEPDMPDQSNMKPERAVELWPQFKEIQDYGVSVSSPGTAVPTVLYGDTNNDYNTVGGWYGKYDELMVAADYHDNFTAVHFYFDYPGDFVLDIIEQIHEKTGKPIWITEWGVAQWSQVQSFDWTGGPDEGNWQRDIIVNFMYSIVPKLDKLDYVERYAWFPFDGSDTSKFGNGASGLFFCGEDDPQKGELTSLGKAYAALGNPEGYNPNKVTDDVVVDDGNVEIPTEKPTEAPTVAPTVAPTEPATEPTTEPIEKVNILVGKTATASTVLGGNKATNAIDDNNGSRWESVHDAQGNQWIQVELGGTYKVDAFKIDWETAAAKEYKFQTSMDGTNWTTVCNVTDGKSGQTREESFASTEAKYVRVLCETKTTGYGYSIWEMEVYGEAVSVEVPTEASTEKPTEVITEKPTEAPTEKPTEIVTEAPTEKPTEPVETINVVAGKTATASNVYGKNVAANAIDGNQGSRWETDHGKGGTEWIQVDLGEVYTVSSFKIHWETAAAKEYQFQVSMDGINWTTAYNVTDGKSGETREEKFAITNAKYVRILCTSKTTDYGYSIWEFEVYGNKAGGENEDPVTPIDPIAPIEKINVVLDKTATASNVHGNNVADNAIDGEQGSRWETDHGKGGTEWIQVDLGKVYTVSSFKIKWETAAAKAYKFQVSMNGTDWTTVCDVTDGKSGETREETFAVTEAKYIRIYCETKTTQYGYSIWELEVYGNTPDSIQEEPTVPVVKGNVALNKFATTSSVYGNNIANYAVDGNMGSRWETIHGEGLTDWLQVDLGDTYTIDSFKINWETAAAKEYQFQVSVDGTTWTTVCNVSDGKSGKVREESFAATSAKYVRLLCTSKTTGYGYSIWDMEVYGW